MKLGRAERGMSGLQLLLLLIVLAFATLIGLKLVPLYLESLKIDRAMESVLAQSEVADQSKAEILAAFIRRLDVDEVRRWNASTFGEDGKVTKKGKKVIISINYRTEVPLFGNLSLVATFDKLAEN